MIGEANIFKAAAQTGRLDFIHTGTGTAGIECYATDRPALGADPGGSPVAVVALGSPAGTVNPATGVLSLVQLEDPLILGNGIVKWCRVVSRAGAFCFDMDAAKEGTPEAAESEAIFKDTQVYAGGGLRMTSCLLGG